MLDALSADDIDTDCNGVITMANLTVTMTTTRRLSQEEIEALIDLRIAQLRTSRHRRPSIGGAKSPERTGHELHRGSKEFWLKRMAI